ncbi:MAG: MOSC domain-containing protein [Sulfuricurvum sp.]|nr:MOSC domain-containing protein [Sulfuricurvum sp.]MDD5386030.1 MOSC domain-containing protein [Sulfuricurvum sp.]
MSVKPCVLELFTSVEDKRKRVHKEKLELDENGVLEDKFYAKNNNRLILITSIAAYALAKESGVELEYGSLGENILIDKNINYLSVGNQFKIGEIVLEITQNCTLCKGLSIIDPKLPEILKNDRGLFAKTVTNGIIKKGDLVII